MKLVVWHNLLWSRYKAGVFSALHKLSASRGVEVFVFQIAETEASQAALSPVDRALHRYPYELVFNGTYAAVPRASMFRELFGRTVRSDADFTILAGFERPEFWMQALVLKATGRKFAVFCDSTLNDNPQSGLKSAAKRLFFSMADGAFCYGERSTDYLLYHGVPRSKIHIRRQAAALPAGYTADDALARRVAGAPPSGQPRYLYVGRLSPEKSIDTLIRAFAVVSRTLPNARLAIVGKGKQEAELRTLAAELGVATNVDFIGSRVDDALVQEYASSTALVLPSRSEPWGLVVNEALSFGCPVVVSDRCGCFPELVRDGVTGFGFPWGDVDALADRLVRVGTEFGDTREAAARCIAHIAPFNPETAARGILDGVAAMTAGRTVLAT